MRVNCPAWCPAHSKHPVRCEVVGIIPDLNLSLLHTKKRPKVRVGKLSWPKFQSSVLSLLIISPLKQPGGSGQSFQFPNRQNPKAILQGDQKLGAEGLTCCSGAFENWKVNGGTEPAAL